MPMGCKQTTKFPSTATVPSDAQALAIATDWLSAFKAHVAANDTAGIVALFLEDSFWRDILALTSEFRTVHSAPAIKALLDEHLLRAGFDGIELAEDALRAPTLGASIPGLSLVQLLFEFETRIGRGLGVVRLAPSPEDEGAKGIWKAYTMYTCLNELKAFPEKVGSLRNADPMHDGSWEETRRRETEFVDREPTVLVVGAGHVGLEIAARLKNIGVETLVVEKSPRIGDSWRNRYKSLSLHDPVWYHAMPVLPFPSSWPVYAPARKLADWLESYAYALELDVWTSSPLRKATWDDTARTWRVEIARERSGQGVRVFNSVKHLVFATGFGGGVPRMPDIPGKELFKGTVCHSSGFTSAKEYTGKRAIVVGSGASGHDVALDFHNHGVDVTMYQRSSTFILSCAAIMALIGGLYNETVPTDYADHINTSYPFSVLYEVHKIITPHLASAIDKDLIEDLEKAGFKTNLGIDNSGIFPLMGEAGGGYYIGASKHIINGNIKLKHGSSISHFTSTGLAFADGTELEADIVVFCTGWGSPIDSVKDIIGPCAAARVGPIWGYDEEGEMRGVWRKSGQKGLWFAIANMALARFYSNHLAIQIKAIEEGLMEL